jgi:hypothetical protein
VAASTKFILVQDKVKVLVLVWRKAVEVNGDYEKSKLRVIKKLLRKRFLRNLRINKLKIDLLIFTRKFLYFTEVFYFFSRYDSAYLDDSYLRLIKL